MCSIARIIPQSAAGCNELVSSADIPHSRALKRVDYAEKVNIVTADTIVTDVITV